MKYFLLKFKISWDSLIKKISLFNCEETIVFSFSKEIEFSKALHALKQFTTQKDFFDRFDASDYKEMVRKTKKKDSESLRESIFRVKEIETDALYLARTFNKSYGTPGVRDYFFLRLIL